MSLGNRISAIQRNSGQAQGFPWQNMSPSGDQGYHYRNILDVLFGGQNPLIGGNKSVDNAATTNATKMVLGNAPSVPPSVGALYGNPGNTQAFQPQQNSLMDKMKVFSKFI